MAKGTESGEVVVMRGHGVERLRRRGTQGDQHVRLVVDVPKKLSEEEEGIVRKLADVQEAGVREKGFWQELLGKLTS